MKHAESNLQSSCITWFRLQYPRLSRRLFAIPNGGSRSRRVNKSGTSYSPEAMRMKLEGVLSGVPDIFLAIPKLHYGGLFIEMKAEKGRLSPAQKVMIDELNGSYKVEVCYSFDEFQKAVNDYLK